MKRAMRSVQWNHGTTELFRREKRVRFDLPVEEDSVGWARLIEEGLLPEYPLLRIDKRRVQAAVKEFDTVVEMGRH